MPKPKILHLFILIALIAVFILPFYTMFVVTPLYKGFIVAEAEKIVKNIANHMALHLVEVKEIEKEKLPTGFIHEVIETKKLLGLWKINIYSPDRTIAYSSELTEIGTKTTENFFPKIISAGKAHTLISKKKVVAVDGSAKELDLVESYVPIVVNGKRIGVLGNFHNLSKNRNTLSFLTSSLGLATYLVTISLVLLIIFLAAKINKSIRRTEYAEKQLKIYASRLEILRQIDAAILAIQTPEAIARIAIDHVTDLIPYQRVLVYSYDLEENKSFLLAAKSRPDKSLADIEPEKDLPELAKMMQGKVFIESPAQEDQIGSQAGLYTVTVPLLTGQDLVGSLEIECDSEIPIDDEDFQVVKEISAPLALAIQNGRLFASVDEHRRQLRTLSVRLSEMEEAERGKIAVELHDRVGQNLTALNINLNIIKSRIKAGMIDSAEVCITDSFLLIEETTEQIRDIMSELRPPNLDDHGLLAALKWYVSQRSRRSGLKITVSGNVRAPRPALEVEMTLFRIAQEALNNVIKHAKAHTATVTVDRDGQKIIMEIKDDGIGFDNQQSTAYQKKTSSLGMIAMQERISTLGGTLTLESSREHGSTIIVEV
ncbi:MAG: GAF domain-containing sensor histidine kinase [Thermodesulfobacteriota bacterium]